MRDELVAILDREKENFKLLKALKDHIRHERDQLRAECDGLIVERDTLQCELEAYHRGSTWRWVRDLWRW